MPPIATSSPRRSGKRASLKRTSRKCDALSIWQKNGKPKPPAKHCRRDGGITSSELPMPTCSCARGASILSSPRHKRRGTADVAVWPSADLRAATINVRSAGRSGLFVLAASISHFDPTRTLGRMDSRIRLYRLSGTQPRSVGLDIGRADHLGPLLGFDGDQLAEVGRRAR